MSESRSRKCTHSVEPLQETKVGWKLIRAMAGLIGFLSWNIDRCSAKRVLIKGNLLCQGCKWIAKQFYSNDYHTGITAEFHAVLAVWSDSGLTFHRVTTLQIGHRKLLRGLHVQSKTIFNIFYHISRILSDILISKTFWKHWIYCSGKMLWVVGKSRLGLVQLAGAGWVKLESAQTWNCLR